MFTPLNDRVLIKRIEADSKTEGGIYIPETAQEAPAQGVVIAAGPGSTDQNGSLIRMTVSIDDVVMFGKWSGTEIIISGEKYVVMREDDIFGIIK